MKQIGLTTAVIGASTFACAALLSFGWSEQGSVSLSVESAQARVGRPLTPMSGAGVARRHYRRGAYGYGYGAHVGVGLGAAAIGTAAAVGAAASPWGWGGHPDYADTGYYGGAPGGPYYGTGVRAARAAYYAAPAATTEAAPPWSLWVAYHANGPWYGYGGWDDYKARNGIICDPGSLVKAADGITYHCQ